MSEYLRHTADHVSWLMRQTRREIAETGQLAARISHILQRRGQHKGLAGILGPEEVRRAAGLVRPKRAESLEPAPAEPEPAPEQPESVEPEAHVEQPPTPEPEMPEVGEPEPLKPEAEAEQPLEPEPGVRPEPALSDVEGARPEPVEGARPEPVEGPVEGAEEDVIADVELDIKEAAAEAAAVEAIPTEFFEEETATEVPDERGDLEEELMPHEEAAGLADVVAEIQVVAPQVEEVRPEAEEAHTEAEEVRPEAEEVRPEPEPAPGAAMPGLAPADDEVPFEAALEPRALIPRRVEFARSRDETLFNRAIERLGMGEVRRLREGIEMLGHVGGDTAAGVLISLYRIAPQRWRPEVAHQLVNHTGGGIAAFFCRVLDEMDEPATVRIAALRGLFARDKRLATEYLLKAVGDPSDEVRAAAATYLGWLRDTRALPALEQLVRDASQRVAKAALHATSAIRT